MAFAMNQIKRKSPSKQLDIKSCYREVYGNDILTDNVKLGIWQYCNYRFSKRNRGKFDDKLLKEMIEELLSKICYKKYISISINDVLKNENEILYQIKRAIIYGATRSLYFEQASELNLDVLATKMEIHPPKQERMTTDDVVDYFKDIMI